MSRKMPARERLCWPIELWPEPDQTLWARACAPQSPFEDDGGALAQMAPTTLSKYAQGWGRFVAFLAREDPDALDLPPAQRCDRSRLEAYVGHLRAAGVSDGGTINRLEELVAVVCAMDQDFNPRLLNRHIAVLRSRAVPVKSKAYVPPADELVNLGFRLMGEGIDPGNLDHALAFRDGLIIAFLALHPVRMRNLQALHLDKNLVRQGAGYMVVFGGDETKNGAPYEVPLAEALFEPLECYLQTWRPVLAARTGRWKREIGDAVWVSQDGSPMSREALSGCIERRTKQAFGKSINPHAFRDAAAMTLVIADPARIRAAAPLLGHRSLATTEKYYIQATGLEAQRSYLDVIKEARRGR